MIQKKTLGEVEMQELNKPEFRKAYLREHITTRQVLERKEEQKKTLSEYGD